MRDIIRGKGTLDCLLTKADGTVEEWTVPNLVVSSGREYMANLLSVNTVGPITHMGVGSSSEGPDLTDNALGSAIDIRDLTSKLQGSGGASNSIVLVADWAPGEGTGPITEAALFTEATGGIMISRTTFPVKNKEATDTLSIQWTLTIA